MTLIPRDCPICGPGRKADLVAESTFDPAKLGAFSFASRKTPEPMHHRFVRCRGCDVLYVTPVPALELEEAYREAAFDSGLEAQYASRTYAEAKRCGHVRKIGVTNP